MTSFRDFLRDDSGAVTIDWTALTAGLLLLGIMVVYSVFNGGVGPLVDNINATLAAVKTELDLGTAPGSEAVTLGGPMVLKGGLEVPIGSIVDLADSTAVFWSAETGEIIGIAYSPTGMELPIFSTVNSATTFKTPDGTIVDATQFNL